MLPIPPHGGHGSVRRGYLWGSGYCGQQRRHWRSARPDGRVPGRRLAAGHRYQPERRLLRDALSDPRDAGARRCDHQCCVDPGGTPNSPAYVAAKHGGLGLTKAAAIEYATRNIRVNAVGPGYIATPLLTSTLDEAAMQAIADM